MTHDASHHHAPASKAEALRRRAAQEMRSFLILFLYLWVLFGLFVLNQDMITREHGGTIAVQGIALVNALVLAKVMLVIEALELARWVRNQPVAVIILYEALLCTGFFIVFHFIERAVVDLLRGQGVTSADLSLGGGGIVGVLIVAVILFVSLLPFFAFKNVARAIGPDRMQHILFHRPTRD